MERRESYLHKNLSSKQKVVFKKFSYVFNHALNCLKDEYKQIIYKTYLGDYFKFWWIDYYCKSSYYRKRIVAVTAFVKIFEIIYENIDLDSVISC